MNRLQPGTRVKPSTYALRPSREYMAMYLKGSSEYLPHQCIADMVEADK
jgi:hypothetical protein